MSGPGKHRGTHALRKRCPLCKHCRRFREPPGDQGGSLRTFTWRKVDGRWVCGRCAMRDDATPTPVPDDATPSFIAQIAEIVASTGLPEPLVRACMSDIIRLMRGVHL